MELFIAEYVGAFIYSFGGGNLDNVVNNDIYMLDTGIPCPGNCNSPHGSCVNNEYCKCETGYFGNGCTFNMKCKDNCNN